MSIFQIAALCFALTMVYLVRLNQRRHVISAFEAGIWYGVWGVFSLLALFPSVLQGAVGLLRFARVFDLLVVLAMIVVTSLVMISYFNTKAMTRKLNDLVRRLALDRPQPSNLDHSVKSKK